MKMQLRFDGFCAYIVDEDYHIIDESVLGWPPYEWPAQFETNIGNGNPLVRDEVVYTTAPDPSEQNVIYRQAGGCTVQFCND